MPPDLGLAIFRYNSSDARLDYVKTVFQDISVGAAYVDVRKNVFYCVHESMTLPGYNKGGGGQICAFAIDQESGDLVPLNRQPSHGSLPSYVVVDASGKYLLAANHTGHTPITRSVRDAAGTYRVALEYDDATTVMYRLNEDGSIGDACDVFKHEGKGGPLPLQTHSQLHSIERSPSGDVFVVCDKGSDEISVFRIDRENARLIQCEGSPHTAQPGSSPRYSAFHPTLPYLYVNHESAPLISAFRYAEDGTLVPIQQLDLTPVAPGGGPKSMQSDIRIHPSGRYLYNLVRGINEVKVLEVDQASGEIKLVQSALLGGDGPRGCTVSPDGRFLLVAALVSKEVMVWSIGDDGRISPTGQSAPQPYPGNITFFVQE
ncbi:MAG: beta-propeller fold lactonase family protein [Pseudomonadota bacterium]